MDKEIIKQILTEGSEELFKELLTEAVSMSRIINSMKDRTVNIIGYTTPGEDKVRYRPIEIYAYGYTKKGNPAILAWIRNDNSKTLKSGRSNDAIRWRIFRLDRVTSFQNTIQKYDTSMDFVKSQRPYLKTSYKTLPNKIAWMDIVNNEVVFKK